MWVADRLFNDWVRGLYILINIISFKPRLVHVLELQNGGYPVIKAFNLLPRKIRPKLFVTNYGSDVYWYQHLPAHRKKLKRLFALADAFSAECNRDVEIAKSIGFDKMVLETAPVTGGIDLRDLAPLDDLLSIDNRRTIAVKGYQGYWGRAIEALEAIELIPGGALSDYTVEVYSCDDAVAESVRRLRSMGVKVKTFPSGSLTHTQMLALFRRSRAYIGISKSDGISTSMLEAMSQGAIPIQTDTSCASEWITNKEQGFIVPLAGQGDIAGALQKILANDEYVLEAQRVNIDTIRERYDKSRLREVVQSYYKTLMGPDI
jgi:glycosyltransferase involved in cell wall biosynthesis